MRPSGSYTPYATSSRGKTFNTTTFTQFEQGNLLFETKNLLAETRDNTESGNEFDEDSTMSPLISEELMDAMSSGDESDAEPMYTEMLEDIRDDSQSHPSVNRREAC